MLADGVERSRRCRKALRAEPLGGAGDLPGDGCGRQGRRDQARDVGRQSAGLPGACLQGAEPRGTRSRLSSGASRKALPERGRIGIFNRSHYEEVLVVRVHPESCAPAAAQALSTKDIWEERFKSIRHSSAISRATAC
jgi:hypothetical protein